MDVTYDKWSREWNRARTFLGLPPAGLHMLRHVGPSDDIHARRRTEDEVFKRGQWASRKSLRRYEKAVLTQTILARLHPSVVVQVQQCHKHLPAILAGDRLPLVYIKS